MAGNKHALGSALGHQQAQLDESRILAGDLV
jgi:hypothetical protein